MVARLLSAARSFVLRFRGLHRLRGGGFALLRGKLDGNCGIGGLRLLGLRLRSSFGSRKIQCGRIEVLWTEARGMVGDQRLGILELRKLITLRDSEGLRRIVGSGKEADNPGGK